MKKLTTIILFCLLTLALTFSLVACGDKCAHTYDNACDATCNECGEARTVTHVPNDDDGNCLTAITCQNCSEVLTAARSEHEANADDGDCTTAITCKHCTTVLTEAKSVHEANTDDGDCTTAITCSVCGTVTTPAKDNHTACEATCVSGKHCEVCNTEYDTTKNPDNHDLTTVDDNSVCGCGQLLTFAITNSGVNTNYDNFADALAAWMDGTTLTLFSDATCSEDIELTAKGLTLDLNGCTLTSTVDDWRIILDFASAAELTIRDSKGDGYIQGTVVAHGSSSSNSYSTLILESGKVMHVFVIGNFIMTGGSLISEESVDGLGVALQSNSSESKICVTGGEIYGSRYGAWITSGNVIISGDAKITGAEQYAIRTFDCSVVISGTPTISGGAGEFNLGSKITLNTQPADGEVWRVKIDTEDIKDGVFAIPGDGVTLDPAKFTSLMDGYEVKLNSNNELVLCNHSTATTAVSNGNGTHNTTCNCNETTFESNIACSGGVATANHLAVCAYCGGTYGELDANVNYDIIAAAMTAAELKAAVATWLADGNTDISILLAAYADEEMFTAVKTALAESTTADGSINLTLAGVKTIPDEALSDYPISIGGNKLKTLTLTDAETTGKNEPFARCTYLKSVSLPNATTIGEWAFNECSNLTSVYCPKVTTIGKYAFRECAKLKTFDFTNITTIGDGAFGGCDFNTIVLPEVTTIGGGAFENNYNLVSCSAPKATTIGYYPWGSNGTSKLERLELTATGDFTLYNNLFADTPTEQIDLVLNKDKEGQVTQNEDGTATWTTTNQYGGSLTYTFKSITFVGE